MENFTFGARMGLTFFGPKFEKAHWSNKSFGVCASSGVLTLHEAEKKARENAHRKLESSIILRSL